MKAVPAVKLCVFQTIGSDDMLKRMLHFFVKSKTVRNAGWLIAGRIAQMLVSMLVGLMCARYLGPLGYGVVNYASAYTALICSLCTLGINSVIVKELVDAPENQGQLIGTTLLLRAAASVFSSDAVICVVNIVKNNDKAAVLVVMLSCVGTVFRAFDTFNYWFQSRLESKVCATASFIAYLITAAYRVYLMATGKSVVWFAFASSVDNICIALILLIVYKKHNGQRLSFSLECGKKLLGKSYHFIISGLMIAVYSQTDKIMLGHMISETEIGYYSTAAAMANIWCFVLSAIIDSGYPSVIQADRENRRLFEKRNKQLYAAVFYLSVLVSVIFTVFGERMILLLYGESYLPSAAPLRIITWHTAFSYLGVARDAWVVCNNCQKYLKYLYMTSASANVLLNLMLIPSLGVSGAALASLITQILTIVILVFIRDMRGNTKLIFEAVILKGVFSKDD